MKHALLSGTVAVMTAVPLLAGPAHADPPPPPTVALTTADTVRHVGDKVQIKGANFEADLPIRFKVCGDLGCVPGPDTSLAKTGADGAFAGDLVLSGVAGPNTSVLLQRYDKIAKEYVDGPSTGRFELRYRATPVGVTPPDSPVTKNRLVVFKGAFSYLDLNVKPAPYQGRVVLSSSTDGTTWKAATVGRTDEHGRFWLSAPATQKAAWKVSVDDAVTDGQTAAAPVDIKPAENVVATIDRLTPSSTRHLGDHFKITGTSVLIFPNGVRRPNGHADVELSTSPDGARWTPYAKTSTDGRGRFRFRAVAKADLHWRVVLPGRADDETVIMPVDCRIFIDTKVDTRLTADARPEPIKKGRKLTVKGSLLTEHRLAVRNARIALWFRAKGTHKWRFVGFATTGRRGTYAFSTKAVKDGSYQARYWGDRDHFRSTSGSDYVDVR
ncbi:hypothetical protein GCM10027589_23950 [Actinocorallia lasiicapitis]